MRIIRTPDDPRFFNLHSHSRFSSTDALPSVEAMVETVAGYGQPALGLTDHGNMAGAATLYKECKRKGIKPFPGTELYVVRSRELSKQGNRMTGEKRHHMCVVAYTSIGYANLVGLSTLSHRNFYNKPLLDHADFAQLADQGLLAGLAATSGCYFGLVGQALSRGEDHEVRTLLETYRKWFPRFYVELQNHNIVHDKETGYSDDHHAEALWGIAEDMGLPVVVTQDSHYCHREEQEAHNSLKRLCSFGPDSDDAIFPGDGFHLADGMWMRSHHHPERLSAGMEGLGDLLEAWDLEIPELDDYAYKIPFTTVDPLKDLIDSCRVSLTAKGLGDSGKHVDRLLDEISVIKATGMPGYITMVGEVTDWCREHGVFYQARGSATGSLVCYLRGITQLDPIEWGLDFERFISRDRTKPPDIDLDVEHVRRAELVEYLKGRYSVRRIGTWPTFSIEGEDSEDEEKRGKGSLKVRYFARRRAVGQAPVAWDLVPRADKEELHELSELHLTSGYGTHPAGLVLSTTDADIDGLIPLMMVASSNTMVTQYDMDIVEDMGKVKLDVLGLKTLTVLHRCMDFLGRDVFDGLDWIPLNDRKTYAAISRGSTAGVFQLEGYTAMRGVKDLKPSKISDVIAAMALFRPATMNSGATGDYIARKRKDVPIPTQHPIITKATKDTYGILLFQEQVITVLREIGFDPGNLTRFLKAVKASNANIGDAANVIAGYHDMVWELGEKVGMTGRDLRDFWSVTTAFAAYSFNKAHSSMYGVTAYRCAYLLTHHPVVFFAALLNVAAGTDKEPQYVRAVRAAEIRLLKADVNRSGVSYAPDPGGKSVRRGLTSIKRVGDKSASAIVAARPKGGFTSIEQFCELVDHRKVTGIKSYRESGDSSVGTLGVLVDAGAFESITHGD